MKHHTGPARSRIPPRRTVGPSSRSPSPGELSAASTVPAGSADSLELERLRGENAQLKQAIKARPVIDQACGVLMATCSCSAEDAWAVLLDASQHTNIKLRHIAHAVISSTEGRPPPEPVRTALRLALIRRKGGRTAAEG
ncbi:ANTAR domain-containing response regulator [Streptomyces sp. 8N706]|uniref:ANTAR domain-containing response regulator n=1 Tax=Streptomyces sp. 8N706 TaxID=3457416 RepID=UPI003FD26C0A